jgi:hypothetical protein
MGGQEVPMDSFVGAFGVAGERDFNNFGRASEAKRKLGRAKSNRGEERGVRESVKAARIFFPANGEIRRWKPGNPDLSAVTVS